VGLEKAWSVTIPLDRSDERVLEVNLAADAADKTFARAQVFVQTSHGYLHVYRAETGRYEWGAPLGWPTLDAFPVSVNKDRVFATNATTLHALDRDTGRTIWTKKLDGAPSSATSANDKLVAIGLKSGRVVAYSIYEEPVPGFTPRSAGRFARAYATVGSITARPILADPFGIFASHDGKVYVGLPARNRILFRFLTGGPISGSLGLHDTRTLIVPSEDANLYSIDLLTSETKWVIPTGAPLKEEPIVAGDMAYVENAAGKLFGVQILTGEVAWSSPVGGSHMLAVTPGRLYLLSNHRDLSVIDRTKGTVLHSPRDSFESAGVNLRAFTVHDTNELNDRIYLATPSGRMACLRELGRKTPSPLRDPEAKPFGTLPDVAQPATTPPDSPAATGDVETEQPKAEPEPEPDDPGNDPGR
jgi:hypothetical protein